MSYRHVFDMISTEFRGIFSVLVNFADLPEFRGSATARNIRSPAKGILHSSAMFKNSV